MCPRRHEIRLVVGLDVRNGLLLNVFRRRENSSIRMIRIKNLAKALLRDLLGNRARHSDLAECVVFQARQLGFRQKGMLRNIRKQLHRFRAKLAEHVGSKRAIVLADPHV